MQTRALKTLARIAKVDSFVVAADELNMTLPAVSMQMKALERELGVTLFDRSFRPPKLTPMGKTVCEHAVRLLAAEGELKAACSPGGHLAGQFRLGFVMTASVRLLPRFLAEARQRVPRAQFEFVTGLSEALEERVLNGDLDAAVVTGSPVPNRHLRYRTLREEPLRFAAPVKYAGRSPMELMERLPFLHFMPRSGVGKLIAGYYQGIDRKKTSTIVLDSVEAIMECVKQGLGFTLLPQPDIERYSDRAVGMPDMGKMKISRQLVLATPREETPGDRSEMLAELLRH